MTALLLIAGHLVLPTPTPAGRLTTTPPTRLRFLLPAALTAGAVLLLPGSLSLAAAALLFVLTTGWTVHDVRTRRRTRHRETVTAAFLGHLVGELQAGAAIPTAVEHATANLPEDTPPELRGVLRQVCGHIHRGVSGAHVLMENTGTTPELAALGTLWSLAERHGLPLAPLVEQAQLRIDTRLRHRAATAATLQGPQATAVILSLLPLAGIAMGTAMGADPLGLLLGGGLGGLLLVSGTGLAAGGFVWSRHIIRRAAP